MKSLMLGCATALGAILVFCVIVVIVGARVGDAPVATDEHNTGAATTGTAVDAVDAATSTAAPAATAAPIVSCCSANVGGMRYSVVSVHRAGSIPGDFDNVYHAEGQFIIVRMQVANATNRPADVSEDDFDLITAANTKFAPDTKVTGFDDALDGTLNPGNTVSGDLVYDVPSGLPSTRFGIQCYANGATGLDAQSIWEAIRLPQSEYANVGMLPQ